MTDKNSPQQLPAPLSFYTGGAWKGNYEPHNRQSDRLTGGVNKISVGERTRTHKHAEESWHCSRAIMSPLRWWGEGEWGRVEERGNIPNYHLKCDLTCTDDIIHYIRLRHEHSVPKFIFISFCPTPIHQQRIWVRSLTCTTQHAEFHTAKKPILVRDFLFKRISDYLDLMSCVRKNKWNMKLARWLKKNKEKEKKNESTVRKGRRKHSVAAVSCIWSLHCVRHGHRCSPYGIRESKQQ